MTPLLAVNGLNKSFAAPVLRDFQFTLHAGEVHALVGGNGAGKSTFANILAGLVQPDRGEIKLDGLAHNPRSRREAQDRGITLMLQELHLIPTLSIAENLFLGRLPSRMGFVDWKEIKAQTQVALQRVGLGHLDPMTQAEKLGVGHQQLVVLAGALLDDCKVLILDEPTAALTARETQTLFEHVRRLRAEGRGIIYISHRMEELREIADTVSVLRDGERIASMPMAEAEPRELVRLMAGREITQGERNSYNGTGEVLMRVNNLNAGPNVQEVSFAVRAGEILGISGLVGAGRSETLRAIYGADPKDSGVVELGNPLQPVSIRKPADAVKAGLAMITEDRKQDGLLLPVGMRSNVTLSSLKGWLIPGTETQTVHDVRQRLDVRCHDIDQPVVQLSGGNQQKIVLGRWLQNDVNVFLLDEPTRGVDAAAKEAIYSLLRELAQAGKALVVVSSDVQELMQISHRILVMSAGRVSAEFIEGNWTSESLTQAAFKGHLHTASTLVSS